MNGRRNFTAVSITAVVFSGLLALQAAWIPLKAGLAQWLIENSWNEQRVHGAAVSPWPWADTHAVGVLTVEGTDIRQVILNGNSGRNLAFGPVLSDGSLGGADWVLNGHRDTHFRFLQDLQPGDRLRLERADGIRRFRVTHIDIVDSSASELVIDPGVERLSLVTCYPFDTLQPGGPLRYVVSAVPLEDGLKPAGRSFSSG
jgi:sortase A